MPANHHTPPSRSFTFALAGNPNCGKSALFNALTGIRQTTGNWPGVTVERREGRYELDEHPVRLIDLPGIYSLDATSLDEQVTRDYLLSREADLIINVIDASNLERNLYLTVQLLEMGIPMIVALNMMDVAHKRGIQIDLAQLARELGCAVVAVIAITREGITELNARSLAVVHDQEPGGFALAHDECVEQAITDLLTLHHANNHQRTDNERWLMIKLLEEETAAPLIKEQHHAAANESDSLDTLVETALRARVQLWRKAIAERSGEDADIHIADTRFNHAHTLATRVMRHNGQVGRYLSDAIDRVVLSRLWGIPLFLLIMYCMFVFTIHIGGAFIDVFDGLSQALFVDGFGVLLTRLGSPDWLRLVLADGVGGGLTVIATFIPIIACLYLFLSALEDSGYMARAAFVMDRFMRSIGLPGKAFVPLIVGFGCNVPAVMATRTLDNDRERKLTVLMNPFMSCSARLPVYVLFAAAFFPASGQNIVFALYLIGILIALLTGFIMKRTLLTGSSTGFMMELPPYHVPTWRGIVLRTWDRIKLFLRDAGRIIIVMVIALNALASINTKGEFISTDSDHSLLSAVSRQMTPLFAPMGIGDDNWPAVLGILSGVLAKEVVVGTLDTMYSRLAHDSQPEVNEESSFSLMTALQAALSTVPENLSGALQQLRDPLGLQVGDLQNEETAREQIGVEHETLNAMHTRFDGQAGAFAYLLFILLYFPCIATIGAIARETSIAWAMFVATWTTGVAFITATLFYQLATIQQHPEMSILWVASSMIVIAMTITGLRIWARRNEQRSSSYPQPTHGRA
jgi:ferrous iron transport protein B